MLPRFLETGRIVGSTFVVLSSRIIPYDFAYEIEADQIVSLTAFGTDLCPLWLVAENLATPRSVMKAMKPIALDTPMGPYRAYQLIGSGTAYVLWADVDPYCVLPFNISDTLQVIWDFLEEVKWQGSTYSFSWYRFTLEGMLGRNRELVVGNEDLCCLRIGNSYLGFHIKLVVNGSVVWDNYSAQIHLPVPLEQDKIPFKFTVFSNTHAVRNESLFVLFGFRNEPIMIRLYGTKVRLFPNICKIYPLRSDPGYLGECYLRMFGHIVTEPYEVTFQVPTDLPFDPSRSDYWNTSVERVAAGTYKLKWEPHGALISKLIFGTTSKVAFGQVWLTHPVIQVSVTQTLEQTAIVQDASIRLMPRKYSDWAFEKWLFRPLYEFYASIENQILFLGYRSRIFMQYEPGDIVRGEVTLMDNRALLQRMTIDKPVNYDYWMATDAASDFLRRFGLAFGTVPLTPDTQLLPEYIQERSYTATWRPRLGETALDFLNKIAEVAGWRLDFTQIGSVIALPRWEIVGSLWFLVWPEHSGMLLSDIPVSRMNISVDDFQRRNILVVYGIDANTFADSIRVFADLEAFVDWTSERFFPLAVPAYVQFDRPVPSQFMDRFGAWLAERVFVVPAEIEFQTPLNIAVRPGDRLRILNPTEADLHRYELVVTSVRHEIGRELTTFIGAKVYKQVSF